MILLKTPKTVVFGYNLKQPGPISFIQCVIMPTVYCQMYIMYHVNNVQCPICYAPIPMPLFIKSRNFPALRPSKRPSSNICLPCRQSAQLPAELPAGPADPGVPGRVRLRPAADHPTLARPRLQVDPGPGNLGGSLLPDRQWRGRHPLGRQPGRPAALAGRLGGAGPHQAMCCTQLGHKEGETNTGRQKH